jgi:hypothetical protein
MGCFGIERVGFLVSEAQAIYQNETFFTRTEGTSADKVHGSENKATQAIKPSPRLRVSLSPSPAPIS